VKPRPRGRPRLPSDDPRIAKQRKKAREKKASQRARNAATVIKSLAGDAGAMSGDAGSANCDAGDVAGNTSRAGAVGSAVGGAAGRFVGSNAKAVGCDTGHAAGGAAGHAPGGDAGAAGCDAGDVASNASRAGAVGGAAGGAAGGAVGNAAGHAPDGDAGAAGCDAGHAASHAGGAGDNAGNVAGGDGSNAAEGKKWCPASDHYLLTPVQAVDAHLFGPSNVRARWAEVARLFGASPIAQAEITSAGVMRRFKELMRWFLDGGPTQLYRKARQSDVDAVADLLSTIISDLAAAASHVDPVTTDDVHSDVLPLGVSPLDAPTQLPPHLSPSDAPMHPRSPVAAADVPAVSPTVSPPDVPMQPPRQPLGWPFTTTADASLPPPLLAAAAASMGVAVSAAQTLAAVQTLVPTAAAAAATGVADADPLTGELTPPQRRKRLCTTWADLGSQPPDTLTGEGDDGSAVAVVNLLLPTAVSGVAPWPRPVGATGGGTTSGGVLPAAASASDAATSDVARESSISGGAAPSNDSAASGASAVAGGSCGDGGGEVNGFPSPAANVGGADATGTPAQTPGTLQPHVQEAVDVAKEAIAASASYLQVVANSAVAVSEEKDARWRASVASVAAAEEQAADLARQVHGASIDLVPSTTAQRDAAWSRNNKAGVYSIVDKDGLYIGMVCMLASSVQAAADIRDRQHRRESGGAAGTRGTRFDQMYRADVDRFTNVVVFSYDGVEGEAATYAVTSAVEDLLYSTFSSTQWCVLNAVRPAMRVAKRLGRDDYRWQLMLQGLCDFLRKHGDLVVPTVSHYAPYVKGLSWGQSVRRMRQHQDDLRATHPQRLALLTAMTFDWRVGAAASTERFRHNRQRNLVTQLCSSLSTYKRLPRLGSMTIKERRLATNMGNVRRTGGFGPIHLSTLDEAARACPTISEFPRAL